MTITKLCVWIISIFLIANGNVISAHRTSGTENGKVAYDSITDEPSHWKPISSNDNEDKATVQEDVISDDTLQLLTENVMDTINSDEETSEIIEDTNGISEVLDENTDNNPVPVNDVEPTIFELIKISGLEALYEYCGSPRLLPEPICGQLCVLSERICHSKECVCMQWPFFQECTSYDFQVCSMTCYAAMFECPYKEIGDLIDELEKLLLSESITEIIKAVVLGPLYIYCQTIAFPEDTICQGMCFMSEKIFNSSICDCVENPQPGGDCPMYAYRVCAISSFTIDHICPVIEVSPTLPIEHTTMIETTGSTLFISTSVIQSTVGSYSSTLVPMVSTSSNAVSTVQPPQPPEESMVSTLPPVPTQPPEESIVSTLPPGHTQPPEESIVSTLPPVSTQPPQTPQPPQPPEESIVSTLPPEHTQPPGESIVSTLPPEHIQPPGESIVSTLPPEHTQPPGESIVSTLPPEHTQPPGESIVSTLPPEHTQPPEESIVSSTSSSAVSTSQPPVPTQPPEVTTGSVVTTSSTVSTSQPPVPTQPPEEIPTTLTSIQPSVSTKLMPSLEFLVEPSASIEPSSSIEPDSALSNQSCSLASVLLFICLSFLTQKILL